MSRKKRAIGAGRMSPASIAAVVAEVEAYGRGEREGPLTWACLSEFSGFSHVSLWKKPAIKAAFQNVKRSQRRDATPPMNIPKSADERVLAMQAVVGELREIVRAYDELWALYEHNVQRLGIEPDELRRPLDTVERGNIKSRRLRTIGS